MRGKHTGKEWRGEKGMDEWNFLLNVEVNERNRRIVLEVRKSGTLGPREQRGATAGEFVCEVGGSVGGRETGGWISGRTLS